MKIENGEVLIRCLGLSQGLNALIAKACVQFFFIDTEARSNAYQSCAEKTAEQDDCHDLDREFCQSRQLEVRLP
jgi:hypothetical protein